MFSIAICRQSGDKWQIKNSISNDVWSSSIVLTFSIAAYPVWIKDIKDASVTIDEMVYICDNICFSSYSLSIRNSQCILELERFYQKRYFFHTQA